MPGAAHAAAPLAARHQPADRRTIADLLAGIDLAGHCWCYTDLGERNGFSIASGDDVHFHAVLYGSVRLALAGGEVMRLGAGSAVIVLSGEAHAVRTLPDSAAPSHALLRMGQDVDVPPTVSFSEGGRVAAHLISGRMRLTCTKGVTRAGLPATVRVGAEENGAVAALLRPEAIAIAGMGSGSAAVLTRLAALLLVTALRTEPRCRRMLAPDKVDPVAEALRLIEHRPAIDWTVEKLARAVGMGRSSFAAQFTRTLGHAPMEALVNVRMKQAAAMVGDSRLKIAEIGELVGYCSEAAFSRRFTRHFGQTPSHMRDAAREAAKYAGEDMPLRTILADRPAPAAARTAEPGMRASVPPACASSHPLLMLGRLPSPASAEAVCDEVAD